MGIENALDVWPALQSALPFLTSAPMRLYGFAYLLATLFFPLVLGMEKPEL